MGYYREKRILEQFGRRLKSFRNAAELSQEQVQHATGIGQSNLTKMESGKLNTSLSQVGRLSDFFGVPDHELLNYKGAIPDGEDLRRNVFRYLKKHGITASSFEKRKLKVLLEKLLHGKFLNSPKYAREISSALQEKYGEKFNTMHISQAMGNLHKQGLIAVLKTDKKNRFQYLKR